MRAILQRGTCFPSLGEGDSAAYCIKTNFIFKAMKGKKERAKSKKISCEEQGTRTLSWCKFEVIASQKEEKITSTLSLMSSNRRDTRYHCANPPCVISLFRYARAPSTIYNCIVL